MNRIFFGLIFLLANARITSAQHIFSKPPITNETYKCWTKLGKYAISDDGRYAWYMYGALEAGQTLVITSTDSKYRQEFPKASEAVFSQKGNHFFFKLPGDSLGVVDLKKRTTTYQQGIKSFAAVRSGKEQLLAVKSGQGLIIKSLDRKWERKYDSLDNFLFNQQGTALVIQSKTGLTWIDLLSWKGKIISNLRGISNLSFDPQGGQLLFNAKYDKERIIALYQTGMDSARIQVRNITTGIKKDRSIGRSAPAFSADGQFIYFKLEKVKSPKEKEEDVITGSVDVWNYKDKVILSDQGLSPASERDIYAAVSTANKAVVVQLEDSATHALFNFQIVAGKMVIPNKEYILTKSITNEKESYWNKTEVPVYKLLSLKTGEVKSFLPTTTRLMRNPMLSTAERFITWFDTLDLNIYSYELSTSVVRNVTDKLRVPADISIMVPEPSPGFVSDDLIWIKDDSSFLLRDKYDIWQIDPLGVKAPINITGGQGRKNGVQLLAANGIGVDWDERSDGQQVPLLAMNEKTKDNGFWTARLGSSLVCEKKSMGPHLYRWNVGGGEIRKSKKSSKYLVTRQSVSESPNLYVSDDLKTFQKISDIHPEKGFNWITSELVTYPMKDGKTGEGILYKPENFDPSKKYPVIFHYYQLRGDELHKFQFPGLCLAFIEISWYVSNGYIVFVPDIANYEKGRITENTVNSVVSAVDYLTANYRWIDKTKMGLQGQSFGGYETNILITKTNLFAAANSVAGPFNLLSFNGDQILGGASTVIERGQFNFGVSLWEKPDVYIKNSPLFDLHRVSTPLLIMHNKKDGAVPFSQAIELFTSLRRLQKPAWLLQYDEQLHSLSIGPDALDFTIRQEQFFDHYLKGKPAPVWMTQGIPAKDKGIRSGLAPDPNGKCSETCPVCNSSVIKNNTTSVADQNN